MTIQEFLSSAAAQQMVVAGSYAFGEFQSFPFTLNPHQRNGEVTSVTAFLTIAGVIPNKVFSELRKSMKPLGTVSYQGSNKSMILFTCGGGGNDLWNRLQMGLGQLTQCFWANGIGVPQECPICHRPGCDALAFVNGYVPVHAACVENQAYGAIAQAENNRQTGNYALGLLGAIAGAFVGAIPTILLILLLNIISAWLYALIPLGAYFGYKLCKGKMVKSVVIPIVIVLSLLMVMVVELIVTYIAVGREYSWWMGVGEFLSLYFQAMSFGDIMADIGLPLLFTALGIFISWDQIRRGNIDIETSADLTLKSLFRKGVPQNFATISDPQIKN